MTTDKYTYRIRKKYILDNTDITYSEYSEARPSVNTDITESNTTIKTDVLRLTIPIELNSPAFTTKDYGNQECRVHCYLCPCEGNGAYRFHTPGQSRVFVNEMPLVIINQTTNTECCVYGCPATITNGTSIFHIDNHPVAFAKSTTTGLHNQLPITISSHSLLHIM